MRDEIYKNDLGSSGDEMKSYRNMLIKSKKPHHKLILNFNDLYSMSTLKDLLFHVQEHKVSITQIQEFYQFRIEISGFEANSIFSHFKLSYNNEDDLYNLNKWKEYEEANPRTFIEMYQFGVKK